MGVKVKKIFHIMSCLMLVFLTACGSEQSESTKSNEIGGSEGFYELEEVVSEGEYLSEPSGEKLILETEAVMEQIAVQTEQEESSMEQIQITIGDQSFAITLYDNAAAKSLAEKLPITLNMSELHGNKKYAYLEESLPTDSLLPEALGNGGVQVTFHQPVQ